MADTGFPFFENSTGVESEESEGVQPPADGMRSCSELGLTRTASLGSVRSRARWEGLDSCHTSDEPCATRALQGN